MLIAGISQSLCPASAQNTEVLNAADILATLAIPPQVSLTAGMLGCFPRVSNISEFTSRPDTTPGKLYIIIGMGLASASSVKKATIAAWSMAK
jgi:hypothetical protein